MTALASPPAFVLEQKSRGTAEPKSVQGVGLPHRQNTTFAPRYQQIDAYLSILDLFAQLDVLFQDATNFDEECLPPTERAIGRTFDLLREASFLPKGIIYPDGDGGLRVEWVQGNKQLRLAIHRTDPIRDYLYHQEGIGQTAKYNVVPLTDSSTLTAWLPWFLLPSSDAAIPPA